MQLSRLNLKHLDTKKLVVPDDSLFGLPEKVLQFGTGALLRGLPDFFVDKANRQGLFNGRIVVVKSTQQGDINAFARQDGLYTVCVRGIERGENVEENIINAAISRVLDAHQQWESVLDCARNPQLGVVVSNTTEVGIQLVAENIQSGTPVSFPGKLLAFLYARFKAFGGSPQSGMVILPTELLSNNGKKLENIVMDLARLNGLEDAFMEWLKTCNYFCNTLVDRIVPGKPTASVLAALQQSLGYEDDLLLLAEPFRLWAIEGGEAVKNRLSFAGADAGIVIQEDIDKFKELKLRLLNGTHTLSCGLAFLAGMDTVRAAMEHASISNYITSLLHQELAPSIPYEVAISEARTFGHNVLDRFRNPHMAHQWISITMQYSSKMKTRCLPLLVRYYSLQQKVPEAFALGFAAYLAFTRPVKREGDNYWGEREGAFYPIQDEQASIFYERWKSMPLPQVVSATLQDRVFWGMDLSAFAGFQDSVIEKLKSIQAQGMKKTIEEMLLKFEPVS